MTTPALPGAIGVTHLKVYEWPTSDGLAGGSPHVHFACSEAYYVIGGQGAVQTLSAAGFAETPLTPGRLVWFTPGVIHRLINHDRLEILVIMQNAGLPEAGDFVLTFPLPILHDAEAYWRATSLASAERVYASDAEAARRRRDLAIEGFLALRAAVAEQGPAALEQFYRAALPLLQPRLATWRVRWEQGPLAVTQATGAQLAALSAGHIDHLLQGRLQSLPAPEGERQLGMCGRLAVYQPEGLLQG